MDPWNDNESTLVLTHESNNTNKRFEDNFQPEPLVKLPDSAAHIAVLEKRLLELRKKNNIVQNLAAYRADCIERLMREGANLGPAVVDNDKENLLEE